LQLGYGAGYSARACSDGGLPSNSRPDLPPRRWRREA